MKMCMTPDQSKIYAELLEKNPDLSDAEKNFVLVYQQMNYAKQELDVATAKLTKLEKQLEKQQKECENKAKETEGLKTELADMKTKLQTEEELRQNSEQDCSRILNEKLQEVEKTNKVEVAKLKDQLEDVTSQLRCCEQEKEEMGCGMSTIQQKYDQLLQTRDEFSKILEEKDLEISKLQQKTGDSQLQDAGKFQEKLQLLEQENSKLSKEKLEAEEKCKKTKDWAQEKLLEMRVRTYMCFRVTYRE